MNSIFLNILDQVNEGIIILDEAGKILFWNSFMEQITGIPGSKALQQNLYETLPSLKRNYFQESIKSALEKGYKPFFAAAMHRGLISETLQLNVRLSAFENNDVKLVMLECIDVTSQFVRVSQLRDYVKKLSDLNRELREKEKEIARLAYYDPLTGVANRALFYNMAEKFLEGAKRHQRLLGLMFVDVDNLKCINDSYGHRIGDTMMVQVAEILTGSVRINDLVARYGGDEFVILLPDVKEYSNYETIATRLTEANRVIKVDHNCTISLSLSIGASFYPVDGDSVDLLISKADRAMYAAKNAGGNLCIPYAENMGEMGCLRSQSQKGSL